MGFFSHACNRSLIEDIEKMIGKNIVLYTADSFAYFGKLSRVTCDRVGLLMPGAGQSFVIVRHPDQTFSSQGVSGEFEIFTLVDLCTVVAITAGLAEVPPGFTFCPVVPDDFDAVQD